MTGRNMRRKSMYWSRHGKHAKIDPALTRHERKSPQRAQQWFASVAELFKNRKKK